MARYYLICCASIVLFMGPDLLFAQSKLKEPDTQPTSQPTSSPINNGNDTQPPTSQPTSSPINNGNDTQRSDFRAQENRVEIEPELLSTYTTVVYGHRPPRSASDFTFVFDPMRTDIPAAGATSSMLLQRIPGIYISQHSGMGKAHQMFLRGFDTAHGQDIEINIGGIPINEVSNIHGQGYADLHFLPPEAVSKVRVIEGAQDPRQGDFATAGSIHFKLGMKERGLISRLSLGDYGMMRGLFAWAPQNQNEETFFLTELAQSDGFGVNRSWRRASAIGQALYDIAPHLKLRAFISFYSARFNSAGVIRLDDLNASRISRFASYDRNQGGLSSRHQALLELQYKKDKWKNTFRSFVVLRDLQLRHNFTWAMSYPDGDGIAQSNQSVTFGGAFMAKRKFRLFKRTHRIEFGTQLRHDRIDQTQDRLRLETTSPHYREVDASLAISSLGIYADLDLELIRRHLHLRGGLRTEAQSYHIKDHLPLIDDDLDAMGFFWGPKVTLEYQPIKGLRTFISYGRGFRSAQALSLEQGQSAPFAIVDAAEVGATLNLFNEKLKLQSAGFYTYLERDIIFDHSVGRNIFTGPAHRLGVTWLAVIKPLSWLQLTHSGTAVRATTDNGDALPYAPTLVMRTDIDGQSALGTFLGKKLLVFGGIGMTNLGSRPLPYGQFSKAIHLFDLEGGIEWSRFSLSFQILNLLDSKWADGEFVYTSNFLDISASSPPARHITAGQPFTAQLTLTGRFF